MFVWNFSLHAFAIELSMQILLGFCVCFFVVLCCMSFMPVHLRRRILVQFLDIRLIDFDIIFVHRLLSFRLHFESLIFCFVFFEFVQKVVFHISLSRCWILDAEFAFGLSLIHVPSWGCCILAPRMNIAHSA